MRLLRLAAPSLALFGAAVQSLAYPGPYPTNKIVIPFSAQSPKTTAPPSVHEFLKRQDSFSSLSTRTVIYATDNICGYFSGRPGAPLSCVGTTHSCFFFPSTAGNVGFAGCCDAQDCGIAIRCLDIQEASNSLSCDNGCLMDTLTLKCTQTARPYCNTVHFFGGITDYFCNSINITVAQDVDTTYRDQVGRTLSTTVLDLRLTTTTSRPPSISSQPDTSTSSSPDLTPPSSNPTPPPQPTSPTPTPDQAASSTPVAPLVGGVVGGVAVIGLIALGIIFLMRKGNDDRPQAPAACPADPSSPVGFPSTPMGGSPPPQQHQPAVDTKYGQQEPMVQTYAAPVVPPPNNNSTQIHPPPPPHQYQYQQQHQQQQPQPYSQPGSVGVGYYASASPGQQQQTSTDPANRFSMAQAGSPVSSMNSQQQQDLSQQSFAANTNYSNLQAYQAGGGQVLGNSVYVSSPPPNVYEVGGHAVGGSPDPNPDHRGQIHQLQ